MFILWYIPLDIECKLCYNTINIRIHSYLEGQGLKISEVEINERQRRFEDAFKKAGIKLTHQRRTIFHEIAKSIEHPDAESVWKNVRELQPSISLDTVYRTLGMLANLGLIKTINVSRERTRFDANLNRHHHFVCVRCGLMRDLYSEQFDRLDFPESVKSFGEAEDIHVEIRGVCHQCLETEKS